MSSNAISFYKQSAVDYFNIKPYEVKGRANAGTEYYKRILYNKLFSVYKFNIPDENMLGWLRFFLFRFGSIAYIDAGELGWIFYPYSITELNYLMRPSAIEVTLMNDVNSRSSEAIEGVIGENAEVVYILDDYFGVDDIITRYAEMLAQCDRSINVNLMNSNITFFASVDNKKDAETLKEAYGRATEGEPFITVNKSLLLDETGALKPLLRGAKDNYIANDILTTRRGILNAFLTEIGIRNSNYDKKERLTTSEIGENNDETRSLVEIIYNNISDCFARCSAMSGETLTVEKTYNYDTIKTENDTESEVDDEY